MGIDLTLTRALDMATGLCIAAAITAAVRCDWFAVTCQVVFAIATAWAASRGHAHARSAA